MATWIELRCENRATAPTERVGVKRCFSHDNEGPMEMSSDDRRSISETLTALAREARTTGWKRTREGWVCPNCRPTGAS